MQKKMIFQKTFNINDDLFNNAINVVKISVILTDFFNSLRYCEKTTSTIVYGLVVSGL